MLEKSKIQRHRYARVSATVLFCHFVFGLVLAAAPSLHKHLHPDFDTAEHACFATILATGGCDAPGVALATVALVPEAVWTDLGPEPCWVESIFQASAVFEHAPPALLS